MAGFIPFIPAAVSIGSSLLGGGGGGGSSGTTSNGTGVPFYTPGGLQGADAAWQNALNGLQNNNWTLAMNPQYQATAGQIQNNPFAQLMQGSANDASGVSTTAGADLAGLSGLFSNESAGLNPFLSNILNMGFDPQQALYNQQFQKMQDQANVTNAQYGLTGQQAAGNVQQADQNFNTNWQNQQLQRALQGLTGAGTVGQTQAGLSQAAGQAGTGAADLLATGGAIPYNAFNTNIQNMLSGLSQQAQFGNAIAANPQQVMASIIPYLNYGSGATNAGVNAAGANTANQQQQGAGISSLFSGLSGLFSGSSPFSGSSFANPTASDLSGLSNNFSLGSGSDWSWG